MENPGNDDAAEAALRRYYAERAPTYDAVYAKPERQADLRSMEAWLPPWFEGRDVIEIACGTGWWTPHAARLARRWCATDANPQMLARARTKPSAEGVPIEFRLADAWTLDDVQERRHDGLFAGFWWSHVPRERLRPWLAVVHARLAPGAVLVMMDNRFVPGSSTPISRWDAAGNTYQARPLAGGGQHEVLKNFPDQSEAVDAVTEAGAMGVAVRDVQWHTWPHYWALSWRLAS
jgi:demethylmenaquinone methyltransferase/2-methoxy-6-polyprenyl-1,4-benzoquinol methylase